MVSVTDNMEERLSAIETLLGVLQSNNKGQTQVANTDDIGSRLNKLQTQLESTTTETFRDTCSESEKLFRDLDAGTALTHQTNVASTPLYYRRQELLAGSVTLQKDMEQLQQMLNLLLVSQQPRQEGQALLREEVVTQAPIVNPTPISSEDERRLDVLLANINDVQKRTTAVASRVDSLLKLYSNLMAMSSEKMVLADEEISARENK